MRLYFLSDAVRGFFAGAQGAFAGEAVEVVAAEIERSGPGSELFAQSGHFAQAARRELRDTDVPADEMDEEDFAAALWEVLFDDIAGLLLEGFVVCVQAVKLRRVPKENSGHARAFGAAVGSPKVLHFNFRSGDDVFGERIAGVRHLRRPGKCDCRIDNSGVLRAREQTARIFRESRANGGHQLARDGQDGSARSKRLLPPAHCDFDMNPRIYLLDLQGACFGYNFHFGCHGFWNAVDTIRQVPLSADEQVPEHLHENHARRSFDRSADGTIQPGPQDALEHFFAANAPEVRSRVFAVQ